MQTNYEQRSLGVRPEPLALDDDTCMVLNLDDSYQDKYAQRCDEFVDTMEQAARRPTYEAGEERISGEWVFTEVIRRDAGTSGKDSTFARIVSYRGSDPEVDIPAEIEGVPVRSIADMAFRSKKNLRRVSMPDTVEHMGCRVFALDTNLEDIRLSDSLAELDASSFLHCRSLKAIHLPERLDAIPDKLLWDSPALERLDIPAATRSVGSRVAHFDKLGDISVDPRNPYLGTDGVALYTADGTRLISVFNDLTRYRVLDGCQEICDGAFKNMRTLTRIELPASVVRIGERAFSHTGISEIVLPDGLLSIGDRAFYRVKSLRRVNFPEGLQVIGVGAFEDTGISQAHLPGSLTRIGVGAFSGTSIRFGRKDDFHIDETDGEGKPALLHAEEGILYEAKGDALHLVSVLASPARVHVAPTTTTIADGAFRNATALLQAELPEGLITIGCEAFAGCTKLARINLPDSLERIGRGAFDSCGLHSLRIGPRVVSIGPGALCTAGADFQGSGGALSRIEVDAQNPVFYKLDGLLCRHERSEDVVVAAEENVTHAHIPPEAADILDFAFTKVNVSDLYVHPGVRNVGPRAFLNVVGLRRVHLSVRTPDGGEEEAVITLPEKPASLRWYIRALRMSDDGEFFDFGAYDAQLLRENDPTEMSLLMLERLEHPVKLSSRMRTTFIHAIRAAMHDLSRQLMDTRKLDVFDRLAAADIVNAHNIDTILERAAAWQQSEAVAYLLNMKDTRFAFAEEDFSF